MSDANKRAQIEYLQSLALLYRTALKEFVSAYEASDATNFSDDLRDAYITASALTPADHAMTKETDQ